MNSTDLDNVIKIRNAFGSVALEIARAIAAQEARMIDDVYTQERFDGVEYDIECLGDRKFGKLETKNVGAILQRDFQSARFTVDETDVTFYVANEWHGDFDTSKFTIPRSLFDAFGSETPDPALKASEVRKYVERIFAIYKNAIDEDIENETETKKRSRASLEEHEKAEFIRLSKKFPNGV